MSQIHPPGPLQIPAHISVAVRARVMCRSLRGCLSPGVAGHSVPCSWGWAGDVGSQDCGTWACSEYGRPGFCPCSQLWTERGTSCQASSAAVPGCVQELRRAA